MQTCVGMCLRGTLDLRFGRTHDADFEEGILIAVSGAISLQAHILERPLLA